MAANSKLRGVTKPSPDKVIIAQLHTWQFANSLGMDIMRRINDGELRAAPGRRN